MFKRDSSSPPGRPPGLPKLKYIRNKHASDDGRVTMDSLSMRFNAGTSSLDIEDYFGEEEDSLEGRQQQNEREESVTLVTRHSSHAPTSGITASSCSNNTNSSRRHANSQGAVNSSAAVYSNSSDGFSKHDLTGNSSNSSEKGIKTSATTTATVILKNDSRSSIKPASIGKIGSTGKDNDGGSLSVSVSNEASQEKKQLETGGASTCTGLSGSASISSRSAPVSQVTTPDMEKIRDVCTVPSSTSVQPIASVKTREHVTPPKTYASLQQQDEEKSLFSGIKERLHDRFQNNLSVVIGKIEEISGESGLGEALERRLRKGDSLDSSKSGYSLSGISEKNTNSNLKREGTISSETSRSRHSSRGSDVFDDCDIALSDSQNEKRSNSLLAFTADEMYQELEDFSSGAPASASVKTRPSSTSGIPTAELQQLDQQHSTASNSSETTSSSKFSLKNWNKKSQNRDKRSSTGSGFGTIETSQSVPLSMSSLLSQKEEADHLEEELLSSQKFYDVEEENKVTEKDESSTSKPNLQSSPQDIAKCTNKEDKPAREQVFTTRQKNSDNNNKSQINNSKSSSPEATKDSVSHIKKTGSSSMGLFTRRQNVVSAMIALVAYWFIPLPSYLSGMISGAVIATCLLLFYQWLMRPPKPSPPVVIPDVRKKPPLLAPEMRESKNTSGKFTGWLNELPFYDPTNYHISNTKSVFIQLDGSHLRLQTPKQGIPKRAMWNEPSVYHVSFIKQRFFDLAESKITLLPEGLVSKRIWSKKYPICITLAKKGKKCKLEPSKQTVGVWSADEAKTLGYDTLNNGELCNVTNLYLFARTCREKEEWYHRFIAVTKATPLPTRLSDLVAKVHAWQSNKPSKQATSLSGLESSLKHHEREGSCESNVSDASSAKESELYSGDYFEKRLMEYIQCMSAIMPAVDSGGAVNTVNKKKGLPGQVLQQGAAADNSVVWGTLPVVCDPGMMWVNAALGRLFFDFLRENYWADKVQDKIQRKLSKIHVPYFIDELTVTGIDLGTQIPVIQRASRPYLDDRGLWLDIDIAYGGGFTMSLETKVNLMKLRTRRKNSDEFTMGRVVEELQEINSSKRCAVTDSAEEDSAESSTDEEEEEYQDERLSTVQTEPAGKKFLKIVDRIAQSKYFQQAAENKYIKKAMEGVSNTRLMLTVEVKSCVGTMALNIPPPPTDRLWYGFRSNPSLVLSAKPHVGHHAVSIAHVTEWIEKKLASEFQRLLVMPNLDDIEIPVLSHSLYDDIITPEEVAEEAGESTSGAVKDSVGESSSSVLDSTAELEVE